MHICIKHFEEQYIKRQFLLLKDGLKITESRKVFKLTADVLPTTFPQLPAYLTIIMLPRKKELGDCRRAINDRDDAVFEKVLTDNIISSYTNFITKLPTHLSDSLINGQ